MSRQTWIDPVAPTHMKIKPAEKQVQANASIAENYYRSAAWRSGYEWRAADAQELAEEQAGLRAPRGSTPKIVYSWQNTETAKNYIRAANDHNEKLDRIKAGEEGTTATENGQQNENNFLSLESAPRPSNPLESTDSLDAFTQQQQHNHQHSHHLPSPQSQPFHSQSPFGHTHTTQPALASTNGSNSARLGSTITLAGFPLTARELPGQNVASLSARHHPTTVQRLHPLKHKANFPLRGAGALPTHRHTTRTGTSKHLAADDAPSHLKNADWSQWASEVEAKLAQSQGTIQTGMRRAPQRVR
jgi:hypothetical protein